MHVCTMTCVCLGAICDRWMIVATACVMAVWTGFWQSDWRLGWGGIQGGGPGLCACYTHDCIAYEEDYTEIREERNPIDRRGVVVGGCHT